MRRPSPERLESARRLLALETLPDDGAAAARVFDKVRLQVTPLIGAAGFQALFARSARLAQADVAGLAGLAGTGPALDQAAALRDCLRGQSPEVAGESAAFLFATLLELLATFIGDRLTDQVLRGGWPAPLPADISEKERK
jgi:hypothetical protein